LEGSRLEIGLGVFIPLFEPLLALGQWTVVRICLIEIGKILVVARCASIACVKKAAARMGQQLFVILVAR